MKYLRAISAIFILSIITTSVSAVEGSIIIQKAFIDPQECADKDCEWIVIKNTSQNPIQLSEYKLNDIRFSDYLLSGDTSLVIAKELIDDEDLDTDSFESYYGDGSQIWGDSDIENYQAVDDSDLGITLNLTNNSGSLRITNDTGYLDSLVWDKPKISLYKDGQTIVDTYGNDLLPYTMQEHVVTNSPPNIVVLINGIVVESEHVIDINTHKLIFDATSTTDLENDKLVYNWIISTNEFSYLADISYFEYIFDESGTYDVSLKVSDQTNKSEFNFSIDISAHSIYTIPPIIISEVMPNPDKIDWNKDGIISDASDEWVELYNTGDTVYDLNKMYISDNKLFDNPKQINVSIKIEPKGYVVLFMKDYSIILNNDKDCFNIFDINKYLIDELCYTGTKEGISYSKINGKVVLSEPTFLSENIEIKIEQTTDKQNKSDDETLQFIDIGDSYSYIQYEVILEGYVIVEPELIGANTLFIQKDNRAIKVKYSNGVNPNVKKDDKVVLKGRIKKSTDGELYIYISYADDITKTGETLEVLPVEQKIDTMSSEIIASLVIIRGTIKKTSGNVFWIDDGTGVVKVSVKDSTNIKLSRKRVGDYVSITGIIGVSVWEGDEITEFVIYPRYSSDVVIGSILGAKTLPNAGTRPSEGVINIVVSTGLIVALIFLKISVCGRSRRPILQTFSW